MQAQTFDAIVASRCEKIQTVLMTKAEEYASDDDRLHNFKLAARLYPSETTAEDALWGMMAKHLVSVLDIVAATKRGASPPAALRDEKIGDAINYLILLEALLIERQEAAPTCKP